MRSVAFGPHDTWVAINDDDDIDWSSGLPIKLRNLLNGRYRNPNQYNSGVRVLAFTEDDYYVGFEDGSWKSQADDVLNESLNKMNKFIKFFSFGGDGSYVFGGGGRIFWRGVPHRMEELIQTRKKYAVEYAAIGHDNAWFLKFSDGAFFWGGDTSEYLDEILNGDASKDRLFLSPFNQNYCVSFCDADYQWVADHQWVGPTSLSNSINKSCTMNPRGILYSNTTASGTFSCGRSLHNVVRELKNGDIKYDDIPAIRVAKVHDNYYSLDNRRLWVFGQAEIKEIPVIVEQAGTNLIKKVGKVDGTSIRILF